MRNSFTVLNVCRRGQHRGAWFRSTQQLISFYIIRTARSVWFWSWSCLCTCRHRLLILLFIISHLTRAGQTLIAIMRAGSDRRRLSNSGTGVRGGGKRNGSVELWMPYHVGLGGQKQVRSGFAKKYNQAEHREALLGRSEVGSLADLRSVIRVSEKNTQDDKP